MRLLKQLGTVAAVSFVGNLAIQATGGGWLATLVLGVATAVLALLAYRWIVRRTEHRAVAELARDGARAAVGRGLALGVTMFVAVIGSIALLGGYHVEGWGSLTGAVGQLGLAVVAGVTEELLFRGVLFRVVEERSGTWIALVLSAVVFGALHLTNPHATLWGGIAIAVEAGLMLGAAYVATRRLWLGIGLHIGWNFAQGGIFGADVSGTAAPTGLLHSATSGPVALSGGVFGPEASVPAIIAGLVMTAVFLTIAHRRGRIVPRRTRAARVVETATV